MLYIPTLSAAYIFGADFSKLYTFRFQVDWIMYKLRFPPLSNWRPPGSKVIIPFLVKLSLRSQWPGIPAGARPLIIVGIIAINCLITPTMSLPLEEGKKTWPTFF